MTRKTKSGFLDSLKCDLPLEKVNVPVDCYAKPLTVGQMRRLYEGVPKNAKGEADEEKLATAIVAVSIVDADGNRLIPDGEEDGLLELPQAYFLALQNAALKANGLGGSGGN